MRRRLKAWASPMKLLAGAFVLVAVYWLATPPARRANVPLAQAPEFTFPDVDGKPTSLSAFRGKVVLLDFWATWCEPCLEELPDLMRLHDAHKSQGFTVVGMAMDAEGASVVRPFARQNKMPYPIMITEGELPSGYPVPGFPTAFLIDREGRVVRRYIGPKGYDELERDLAELLPR
jgi:thiol-disulfide isomerase/thioredoxin